MPELKLNPDSGSEQDVLLGAVEKIYDIKADDVRLRQVLETTEEKREVFFDGLRKNYLVRREFQNTSVIVEDINSGLAKKLKGIGFLLSQE